MNEKELNKLMITNKEVVRRLNKATEKILKLEKKIKITPTKVILSKEAELNIQQKAQQDTVNILEKFVGGMIKHKDVSYMLGWNDCLGQLDQIVLEELKSNWGDKK